MESYRKSKLPTHQISSRILVGLGLLLLAFSWMMIEGCSKGGGNQEPVIEKITKDGGLDGKVAEPSLPDEPVPAEKKAEPVREVSPEDTKEADVSPDGGSPDSDVFAKVRVPIRDRLCLSNPEIHGSDEFVRAQTKWMSEKMKEAGIKWLRYQFFWHRVETKKGSFNFARYDRSVDILEKHGRKVVGVLAYGNPWATKATKDDFYYPPDDNADFTNYVKAIVRHYKGKINRWEVWNEPNGGYRFWKTAPRGDPKAYAKLLVDTIKAAKEVEPKSVIGFAGLFYHPQIIMGAIEFTQKAFAAEPSLATDLDRLSVHPYPRYPPKAEPEDDANQEVPLTKMLKNTATFLPQKALWITELGWPVYGKLTEELQAAYLSRSFLLAFSHGSEMVCWYRLADQDHSVPFEVGFGLFKEAKNRDWAKVNPKPKPAYHALKAISDIVGDAEVAENVSNDLLLSKGEYGIRLKNPQKTIFALWRRDAHPSRTLKVSIPKGTTPKLYDYLGKSLSVKQKSSKVLVELTNTPRYLVFEKN